MHSFRISILLLLLIFGGCSLTPLPPSSPKIITTKIERLSDMIIDLNSTIDRYEAQEIASRAVKYSKHLAQKYRVVSPPLWHNTLVNLGIRKRGLCYQWAEDLLSYLLAKKYQTIQFYTVGSSIGNYFEHNALAISAKGSSFEKGILFDAWRNSGDLYFIEIYKDKRYKWKNREEIYKKVLSRYHQKVVK
ncbi:MAG TPA: hypothetical protein ENK88_00060 [Campylobacterales bacterium]|nr:hypothetical protein [Campylobacterales bacterium]HHH50866.1 hypothetical protein [Campylobacterales bacterium]